MALLHTPKKDETLTAPDFKLKNIDGAMHSYEDIKGEKGTVIAFICNHCPYVHAIIDRLVEDAKKLQKHGIGFACIMSNDAENYPEDNFENMQAFAKEHDFSFPYLIDETQEIAKAYDAICTPDIFGFNADDKLQYRGRLDSAGANPADETTDKELVNAMLDIAKTGKSSAEQFSSMGCSIKWK
ncbi:MAG: thioredoxin family protein [Alphaproteobacteria bacterium]|nr:thioredoxin family protein [Alphaproteobacteria bacterium]